MKSFFVFKIISQNEGKILRHGYCQNETLLKQANVDEFVMEIPIGIIISDLIQKVVFDGLNDKGKPVNLRIVNKTPEEIEADRLPGPDDIPDEQKPVIMTKEQLQQILNRIEKLEGN